MIDVSKIAKATAAVPEAASKIGTWLASPAANTALGFATLGVTAASVLTERSKSAAEVQKFRQK